VIRCRPVDAQRIGEITGTIDPAAVGNDAALTAAVSLIAEATIDIRILGPGDTDEPLNPDGPTRFTPELGELLGWDTPPENAADAVNRFLRVGEMPLAAAAVSAALQQALAGGADIAAREALGESTAAA